MAGTKNGPELHPTTLELAQGANFAAITTALPGGDFQNHYIWVGNRQRGALRQHRGAPPRSSRTCNATQRYADDPGRARSVSLRGGARRGGRDARGQTARDHIDEPSQKYNGEPCPPDHIKTERVTLWTIPSRQTAVGSGPEEVRPSN